MIEGGEPLLDGGGDGAEDEDEGQVHPANQAPPEHARFLVKARNVESEGVVELVRPRYGQELLPPPAGDERDVETKDEGERDQGEKGIEVFYQHFEESVGN